MIAHSQNIQKIPTLFGAVDPLRQLLCSMGYKKARFRPTALGYMIENTVCFDPADIESMRMKRNASTLHARR